MSERRFCRNNPTSGLKIVGICCLHFTSLRYIFTNKLQPHSSVLLWIDLRGCVADIMPEIFDPHGIKRHFVEKVLWGPSGLEFFGMPKRIASPSAEIPPEFQTTGLQTTRSSSFAHARIRRNSYFCVDFRCSLGKIESQLILGEVQYLQRAQEASGELLADSSKLSPLSHRTCRLYTYNPALLISSWD